nr:hypothetical protein [Tanacetum cinerariifolium]
MVPGLVRKVRTLTFGIGMEMIPPSLHDIISHLQPMAHRRTVKSVIGRILVALRLTSFGWNAIIALSRMLEDLGRAS